MIENEKDEEEKTSFSVIGFDKKFQEKLVKLIAVDKSFSDKIRDVLNFNYFEYKYLQLFVQRIFEYKDKYNAQPTIAALKTIVSMEHIENEALKSQLSEFFVEHFLKANKEQKIKEAEFLKERSIDFCKKQKLKEAMEKSIDCLEKSSFEEISVLINNALKLGTDNDYGHDYLKDFEERFKIKNRNPTSTGWKQMDNIMKGGLGVGELGVVIAPTGVGKSFVLAHLGAAALREGKNVVHYSCELSDLEIGTRYDSMISGIPFREIYHRKQEVYASIKKNISGSLLIKEYPTKSATVRTIKTHLDKLISNGFEPGLVIVDYADLLKPTTNYKEKRFDIETIYEELRGLSREYQTGLWSASQTNRSGLNAEVIDMDSISEAFSKCFVADFIFSLSRTAEDKRTNTGRLFIAKSRLGIDGVIFPVFMDTSIAKIEVLEPEEETEQETDLKEIKNEKSVQRQLKKFFNKNKQKGAEQ